MKGWTVKVLAVALALMVAQPATAQERDWDRIGERIARALERAFRNAEEATERALEALEDADFQFEFDGEAFWDAGDWGNGWWDDDSAGPRVDEEFRWNGRRYTGS